MPPDPLGTLPSQPDSTIRHTATAFGLAEGPGVATRVELRLSPGGIELEADDGNRRVLSLDEAMPSFGGAAGDQLVLKAGNPAQGGLILYVQSADTIDAIRAVAPARLQALLQQADDKRRSKRRSATAAWGAMLIACAAVAWLVVKGLAPAANLVVARIPHTWEVELGEQALKSALSGKGIVDDRIVTEAVQSLTQQLANALPPNPYTFHVQVVCDEQINAFALPGGEIVVNTGLIAAAESPAEVAGVLAHEMHHVVGRHGLKRIARTVGLVAIVKALFGDAAGLMAVIRDHAAGLTSLKYDRGQETEADVNAVRTMAKAGIPPEGMVAFFERLSGKEGKLSVALTFASSHPTSQARLKRVREEIANLPKVSPIPTSVDWDAVRRRCQTDATQ